MPGFVSLRNNKLGSKKTCKSQIKYWLKAHNFSFNYHILSFTLMSFWLSTVFVYGDGQWKESDVTWNTFVHNDSLRLTEKGKFVWFGKSSSSFLFLFLRLEIEPKNTPFFFIFFGYVLFFLSRNRISCCYQTCGIFDTERPLDSIFGSGIYKKTTSAWFIIINCCIFMHWKCFFMIPNCLLHFWQTSLQCSLSLRH